MSKTHLGSARSAHKKLRSGSTIKNRYLIEKCVGSGASSVVYKATDSNLGGLPVALKVFHQSFISLPSFAKMYSSELKANFAVDHENVVRLYDMIRDKSFIALVTEFVEGCTLEEFAALNQGAMPATKVREILIAVSRGLGAIHALNLVHRDVKPQNILISKEGAIKLNDLGLAKANSAAQSKKHAGRSQSPSAMTGTPYYASPEYLTQGLYDHRSDLHSLGIFAFELLSGECLFETNSPSVFLTSKVERDIPPLLTVAPSCPKPIAQIVDTLLQRLPEDRFQSAKELQSALESVQLEREKSTVTGRRPVDRSHFKEQSLDQSFFASVSRGAASCGHSVVRMLGAAIRLCFLRPFLIVHKLFSSGKILYAVLLLALLFIYTQTSFIHWITVLLN